MRSVSASNNRFLNKLRTLWIIRKYFTHFMGWGQSALADHSSVFILKAMTSSLPHQKTGIQRFLALMLLLVLTILVSCKKPDEINALQQQVWKEPQNAGAYLRLGNAYAQSQRFSEAAEAYKSALGIDPTLDDAYHALGAVAFNQKNYPEALKYFQRGLERSPKDSLRLYDIGNVYMQLNEFDKAAKFYSEAIDNSDSFTEAHYNLAICYIRTGRRAEVQAIYEWLLKKNNYLAFSLKKHLDKEESGN